MATRTVTGDLRYLDTAAVSGTLLFYLGSSPAVQDDALVLTTVRSVTTTVAGTFTVDLEVPDDSTQAWEYRVRLPDDELYKFTLASGSATTLHGLLSAASSTATADTVTTTVNALMSAYKTIATMPAIDVTATGYEAPRVAVGGTPTVTAYTGIMGALEAADASDTRKVVVIPAGAYGVDETFDIGAMTNKGSGVVLVVDAVAELHLIDFTSADGSGFTGYDGEMFNVSPTTASARPFTIINRGRIIGNRATLTAISLSRAVSVDQNDAGQYFNYIGEGGVVESFHQSQIKYFGAGNGYVIGLEATDSGSHGCSAEGSGHVEFHNLKSYSNAKLGINIRGGTGYCQGELYSNDEGVKFSDAIRDWKVDLYTHDNTGVGSRSQPPLFGDIGGTVLVNGGSQAGATLAVDGFTTTTGTVEKGIRFKVAGITRIYTVKADATITANAATLSIAPSLTSSPADDAAITWLAAGRVSGRIRSSGNGGRAFFEPSAKGAWYREWSLDLLSSENDLLSLASGLVITSATNDTGTTGVYTYTGNGEIGAGDTVTVTGCDAAYNVTGAEVLTTEEVSDTSYRFTVTLGSSGNADSAIGGDEFVSTPTQVGAIYLNTDGPFSCSKTKVTGTQTADQDLIFVTHNPLDSEGGANEAGKTQRSDVQIDLGSLTLQGIGSSASGVNIVRGVVRAGAVSISRSYGYGITAGGNGQAMVGGLHATEETAADMTALLNADTGTITVLGGDVTGVSVKTAGSGLVNASGCLGLPQMVAERVTFYAQNANLSMTTDGTPGTWTEHANRLRHLVDSLRYTQVRLTCFVATGGGSAELRLEYLSGTWQQATTESTYIDCSTASNSSLQSTGWLTLADAAKVLSQSFRFAMRDAANASTTFTAASITAAFR